MLEKAGVLISSKIDTHDKTYIAWRNDDAISLQEFLKYSISQSWIDTILSKYPIVLTVSLGVMTPSSSPVIAVIIL